MGEVAQSGTLDHIGARRHRTAQRVLHAVALGKPNGKEGSERGVAGAHRGADFYIEGAVGEPQVLPI